jgi:DNA-binding response OmpR family regulator
MAYSALIIDDDESIRGLITDILEPFGFNVRTASTGAEGVLLAQEYPPDIILCDMILPDTMGSETVLKLRQDPALQQVPIIIVTGYPYLQPHAQHLNCTLLTKPFSMNDIVEKAREAVGAPKTVAPQPAPAEMTSAS